MYRFLCWRVLTILGDQETPKGRQLRLKLSRWFSQSPRKSQREGLDGWSVWDRSMGGNRCRWSMWMRWIGAQTTVDECRYSVPSSTRQCGRLMTSEISFISQKTCGCVVNIASTISVMVCEAQPNRSEHMSRSNLDLIHQHCSADES